MGTKAWDIVAGDGRSMLKGAAVVLMAGLGFTFRANALEITFVNPKEGEQHPARSWTAAEKAVIEEALKKWKAKFGKDIPDYKVTARWEDERFFKKWSDKDNLSNAYGYTLWGPAGNAWLPESERGNYPSNEMYFRNKLGAKSFPWYVDPTPGATESDEYPVKTRDWFYEIPADDAGKYPKTFEKYDFLSAAKHEIGEGLRLGHLPAGKGGVMQEQYLLNGQRITLGEKVTSPEDVTHFRTKYPECKPKDSARTGDTAKTGKTATVSFDAAGQTLSISGGAIAVLDSVGGTSGQTESQFAGDPILGAMIHVDDLSYEGYLSESGAYWFTGGSISISDGNVTYLSAKLPNVLIGPFRPGTDAGDSDLMGTMTEIYFNLGSGSRYITSFYDSLVKKEGDRIWTAPLIPQLFADFNGDLATATAAFTKSGSVDEVMLYEGSDGVPEPGSLSVVALGGLWMLRSGRGRGRRGS